MEFFRSDGCREYILSSTILISAARQAFQTFQTFHLVMKYSSKTAGYHYFKMAQLETLDRDLC